MESIEFLFGFMEVLTKKLIQHKIEKNEVIKNNKICKKFFLTFLLEWSDLQEQVALNQELVKTSLKEDIQTLERTESEHNLSAKLDEMGSDTQSCNYEENGKLTMIFDDEHNKKKVSSHIKINQSRSTERSGKLNNGCHNSTVTMETRVPSTLMTHLTHGNRSE